MSDALACLIDETPSATPIRFLAADAEALPPEAKLNDFSGQAGRVLLTMGEGEPIAWVGLGDKPARMATLRALPAKLPAGDYRIEEGQGVAAEEVALAWTLGAYAFDRFKSGASPSPGRVSPSPPR